MKSAVASCSLVVVLFLGGCAGAALPEAEMSTSPTKETDMPSIPYVAASMPKITCQQKDVCADALNSAIDTVECVEGGCSCLYNHVYTNGTCFRKKEYGDDDVTRPSNMAEEGSQRLESSTSSPYAEPTQPDKAIGEMSPTTQKPDAHLNTVESENSPTSQPSETTTTSPTMMTTPVNNEDVKEAAPSNVEPVDSPREVSINQSHVDEGSMQGDQPAEPPKSTEMPRVGLLQNCSSNLQCEQHDAACVDGTCECKEGYVINPAQDRCLKVATKFKDICEEDIQCIGKLSDSSYCSNKMCVCKIGTIESGATCASKKGLGDPCSVSDDCLVGMVCSSGECACSQGSQSSDDKTRCTGNGGSSTVASLVVLCLGLLSASQLRRYP